MKLQELEFNYPEELVAQHPAEDSRIMFVQDRKRKEISKSELLAYIPSGDVFVINDTKVIKRRVFGKTVDGDDVEILFIEHLGPLTWSVLAPMRKHDVTKPFLLPDDIQVKVVSLGIPQTVEVSRELTNEYFQEFGELPLPPYILKARNNVHNIEGDENWYQTQWAEIPGSQAAPTASFHFTRQDLEQLQSRGVKVERLTLHVGLGTFLPVRVEDLNDHQMHAEYVQIPRQTWDSVQSAQKHGRHIWSLGTTVARSLEACALGHLNPTQEGFSGTTDILIQEGFQFKVVDRLLTNFHQPRSTLLALVCGFYDKTTVFRAYEWAIEQKFRLFSYGDLSVWIK